MWTRRVGVLVLRKNIHKFTYFLTYVTSFWCDMCWYFERNVSKKLRRCFKPVGVKRDGLNLVRRKFGVFKLVYGWRIMNVFIIKGGFKRIYIFCLMNLREQLRYNVSYLVYMVRRVMRSESSCVTKTNNTNSCLVSVGCSTIVNNFRHVILLVARVQPCFVKLHLAQNRLCSHNIH